MRLFSTACTDVSFQDAIETFNTRRNSKDATAEVRSGLTGLDGTFQRCDAVILYGYL